MTNLKRLLSILKDGQWHSGKELAAKVSWRFGHTVYEARKKGFSIEMRKVAHNQFEYRLVVV
jgi:hypothetical protein